MVMAGLLYDADALLYAGLNLMLGRCCKRERTRSQGVFVYIGGPDSEPHILLYYTGPYREDYIPRACFSPLRHNLNRVPKKTNKHVLNDGFSC